MRQMVAKTKKTIEENSREFLERKELIKLQRQADLDRHKFKMEELEFSRESDRLFHEREMERNRIKSAEIRKAQERRANQRFMESYGKKC